MDTMPHRTATAGSAGATAPALLLRGLRLLAALASAAVSAALLGSVLLGLTSMADDAVPVAAQGAVAPRG